MFTRLGRALGVGGARAVAATLVGVVAAAIGLARALSGNAGVPEIVGWVLAVLVAVVVVFGTVAEQTAGARARARQVRGWIENHFGPRSRGVARKGEPGDYFTGRTRALRELVTWLGADLGGLSVVTGDPGSGKSAVLGRLVTLAD